MDRMFRFAVAAALVAGLFLAPAHAQTFNKKKPKTTTQVWSTDSTDIAIPGERYGKYVWRQVGECKATWFSDGNLKTCEGIEGTKRWRLEDSGDFGDRVFWDPGPGPEPASDILTPSLLTALLIVFVDVMKELPATLIMRPFNFDTLAVQAHRLASDERLDGAAVPSLVIVAVGLLPVILICRQVGRRRQ